AKIQLSSSLVTRVRVPLTDSPGMGHLEADLTREQLESLTADLLGRMTTCTQQALVDSRLTPEDIDRVILVGGAPRMTAVRDLVRNVIGKEPYRYIDPDKVVAMGAAIQAGMLLGVVEKAVLLDVLPLSLGVETQGGLIARILPRNTPLPASGASVFGTAADYQTTMDIHVLQGERELASDNISLGQLQLTGIPSALRGVPKVEVTFEADVDGIVHVSAEDLLTESEVKAKLASTKLLDPQEIGHLTQEAQRNARHDEEKRKQIRAQLEAENLIAAAEIARSELAGFLTEVQMEQVLQASSRLKEALASSVNENIQSYSAELRELLTTIHKDRPRTARSLVGGQVYLF
ncbi:MAG: Hsp70 family protein, partial [Dehalococcoidia bacterium]